MTTRVGAGRGCKVAAGCSPCNLFDCVITSLYANVRMRVQRPLESVKGLEVGIKDKELYDKVHRAKLQGRERRTGVEGIKV